MNNQNDLEFDQDACNLHERQLNPLLTSYKSIASDMDYYQAPPPPRIIKQSSTQFQEPLKERDLMARLVREPSLIYNHNTFVQLIPVKTRSDELDNLNVIHTDLDIEPNVQELNTSKGFQINLEHVESEKIVVKNIEVRKEIPVEKPRVQKSNTSLSSKQEIEDSSIRSRKPSVKVLSRSRSRSLIKSKQPTKNITIIPCTCTKSHCLQMYCSCFHNGLKCSSDCKCEECKNISDFESDINDAREHVQQKAHRTHQHNEDDLFNTKALKPCNCRKTHCLKGYCECFIRKAKCTEKCNCNHCENGKDEDLELYNNTNMYKEVTRRKRRRRNYQRKVSNAKSASSAKSIK